MKNKRILAILLVLFVTTLTLAGCAADTRTARSSASAVFGEGEDEAAEEPLTGTDENVTDGRNLYDQSDFYEEIPEWNGVPFYYLNGTVPSFAEDQVWTKTQEQLDELDDLGRCGTAISCIGVDGMPTEKRGNISEIKPTGWHTDRYDFIEGEALFNRCHLIAHQLSGDDAVDRNLITGTSYMNREGMLPFEEAIGDYVRATGNHVMYQVTPVFVGEELVARGVHMEAVSVEDGGAGISFNVFCYNVQPGIEIDYATGDNQLAPTVDEPTWEEGQYYGPVVVCGPATNDAVGGDPALEAAVVPEEELSPETDAEVTQKTTETESAEATEGRVVLTRENCRYVVNTRSKKFHYPSCSSVDKMAEQNTLYTDETREELIEQHYEACKNCNP